MFGKKEHTNITSHAWTVCDNCGEMMFVADNIGRKYRCQFCRVKGSNYRTTNLSAALTKSREIKEQGL